MAGDGPVWPDNMAPMAAKGGCLHMEIEYWKSPEGYWCFDKPFTGYVDKNILSGFLQKENISIEDFLINKKYVVIQDGDEYCYWDDMKKSGLVNMDAINYEYTEGDY